MHGSKPKKRGGKKLSWKDVEALLAGDDDESGSKEKKKAKNRMIVKKGEDSDKAVSLKKKATAGWCCRPISLTTVYCNWLL